MTESWVGYEPTKCVPSDCATTDTRVPVHPATERLRAVVHVEQFQPREADQVVELLERCREVLFACELVTGGEYVAGVEKDNGK